MDSADLDIAFDGTAEATLHYKVLWKDSIPFQAALLGYPEPPTYLGTMREPHSFPELPALKCLRAKRYRHGRLETDPATPRNPDFEYARIEATYAVPKYEVGNNGNGNDPQTKPFGAFAEETSDISVEMLTTGEGQYVWETDLANGVQPVGHVTAPIGIPHPIRDRSMTLTRVRSVNYENMMRIAGSINYTKWAGSPPETLMFMGLSTRRQLGAEFQPLEVTLHFKERWESWNRFYRPDSTVLLPPPNPLNLIDYWQYAQGSGGKRPLVMYEFAEAFAPPFITFA